MFWIVMLIVVLLVIGASVLIGTVLNKRSGLSARRQHQVSMAKASGAFRHRKSNRE